MNLHPYRGSSAAIATKHQKEQILAPIFAEVGISLVVADFDTDLLGTFTGEIERPGSPKEVVLEKARQAIKVTGLPFGLASEGSIGPDPLIPFISSDVECLAWVDQQRGIEIVEFHRSLEIVTVRGEFHNLSQIDEFLSKADFPNHGLILRSAAQMIKGINNLKDLENAISKLDGKLFTLESDLRSHFSPSRQKNIQSLGEKLVKRISTLCPGCETPGWGQVGNLYGLPCGECKNVVEGAVCGELLGCAKCEYQEEKSNERVFVEAAECGYCNP